MVMEAGHAGIERETGRDPFVQLAAIHDAFDALDAADLGTLADDVVGQFVRAAESVRSRSEAFAADLAAETERRGHDRENGFFTNRSYLKHHGLLSGAEALTRTRVTRLFELLPRWARAAHRGDVGVDQVRVTARVASNPRIHEALVEHERALLFDAEALPYDEYAERLQNFERLADPDGTGERNRHQHESRDVTMRRLPDGSWRLRGRFASEQGAEIDTVLAHFIDAEVESDWKAARDTTDGEMPTMTDLGRTAPQRRADALNAALICSAQNPSAGRPIVRLDVLIDETTLRTTITGERPDPSRYRDMVCRTRNGDPIDVTDAARLALWADVRRAVVNQQRVVTDLGRASRLFRGSNRDAALLLFERCVWPGCDQRVRTCQADHAIEWMHNGTTDPDNAACLCGRHNRLKHDGQFTADRTPLGNWTISHPRHGAVG
jgi:hypothetical protein